MTADHPSSDPAALPDVTELARLVTNVTEPMCGMTFTPAADHARGQSICGRMYLLPIAGQRDITIVLSSDAAGCQTMGAAMFRCPPEKLTRHQAEDAIRELLNMVAGQIQTALEIDQQLGLPRSTTMAELAAMGAAGFKEAMLLTSNGSGDIRLWIFEKTPSEAQPANRSAGFVRSLFRKFSSG